VVSYPNSVPRVVAYLGRIVRVVGAVCLLGVGLFLLGIFLDVEALWYVGLCILLFFPLMFAGIYLGRKRRLQQIPQSIEIEQDRLVAHLDPKYARAGADIELVVPYERLLECVPGTDPGSTRFYGWTPIVVPSVTYSDRIRRGTEVVSTEGLPKGVCRRYLLLSPENLERVTAAYQGWRSIDTAAEPIRERPRKGVPPA
jgi:hypothetical protein